MGSPQAGGADTHPLSFSSPARMTDRNQETAESEREEPEASVGLGADSSSFFTVCSQDGY